MYKSRVSRAGAWIETYRGTVSRWEVDNVDHFTVAYYFQRFADASLALLEAAGLGPPYVAATGRGCPPALSHVRYAKELRAGDLLHVESGVIAVDGDGATVGHKLFESNSRAVCATVEERARHVDLATGTPVALARTQQDALRALTVAWDGPAREPRPAPLTEEGFVEGAREFVKPCEIDVYGQSAPPFFVHRFSAANGHLLAALGMTPAYQRERRRGFSTFEFQLAFLAPLRPGEPAVVRTALAHVGTSSMRVHHRMFNGRTGMPVATLDQSGVHLDMEARRPAPLPHDLRARALALLVPVAPA